METIFEISVKLKEGVNLDSLPKIINSESAHKIIRPLFDEKTFLIQEEFIILFLNNNHRVIGHKSLSKGGMNSSIVDTKLVFSNAVHAFAAAIIIAHNHPSGSLKPSESDIKTTNQIKKAGEILNIKLLDHLILSNSDYFSFTEQGLL